MSYAYKEAYSEVYYILQNMNKEDVAKIPKTILETIKNNRAKNYIVNIDPNVSLKSQNIKDETKAILAVLYRKFWCEPEKKELLEKHFLESVKRELKEVSKEQKSQSNINEINYKFDTFENKVIMKKNDNLLVEYKEEKWYFKMFKKIKKLFEKI